MRIYLAGRPQGWNIIKDGKVKSLQAPEMGIYREAIIADMGGGVPTPQFPLVRRPTDLS